MKIEITITEEDDDADDTYGLCSVTVAYDTVYIVEGFKSHIIRKIKLT